MSSPNATAGAKSAIDAPVNEQFEASCRLGRMQPSIPAIAHYADWGCCDRPVRCGPRRFLAGASPR